jgi:hypothetical protein
MRVIHTSSRPARRSYNDVRAALTRNPQCAILQLFSTTEGGIVGFKDRMREEWRDLIDTDEAKHQVKIVLMYSDEGARSELRNLRSRLTNSVWWRIVAELEYQASGPDFFSRQLPRSRKAARILSYAKSL